MGMEAFENRFKQAQGTSQKEELMQELAGTLHKTVLDYIDIHHKTLQKFRLPFANSTEDLPGKDLWLSDPEGGKRQFIVAGHNYGLFNKIFDRDVIVRINQWQPNEDPKEKQPFYSEVYQILPEQIMHLVGNSYAYETFNITKKITDDDRVRIKLVQEVIEQVLK
ncbi:MAG: hypothetical protein NT149_03285 [Candidatus Gottesmanbacteria bacterium]|nr:hypothetical protein [Candidatus Gottesmanbacteria bacterium]